MTTPIKPPPMPPPRKSSGEHKAVKAMRGKYASISENTVAEVDSLNARIDRLGNQVSSHPPTDSEKELPTPPDDEHDLDAEVTTKELRLQIIVVEGDTVVTGKEK